MNNDPQRQQEAALYIAAYKRYGKAIADRMLKSHIIPAVAQMQGKTQRKAYSDMAPGEALLSMLFRS